MPPESNSRKIFSKKAPIVITFKGFLFIISITLFLIEFLSEFYFQRGITEQAALRNDRTSHCAIFKIRFIFYETAQLTALLMFNRANVFLSESR